MDQIGLYNNRTASIDGVEVKTFAGAIDVYQNIFNKDTAKEMVSSFEEANSNPLCPLSYSNAKIGDNHDGGSIRSNVIMGLNYHNDIYNNECTCKINSILNFLKEKLSTFVTIYSEKYEVEIAFDEGLQLLKYGPGKQYKAHTDYGPWGAEHRVVSGLIYINPGEYLGGGTQFVNFQETIMPETPSIALFPSNYAYRHAAQPVFEGYKYAIVTWFGPPWFMNREQ
jgi:hypothetical protein